MGSLHDALDAIGKGKLSVHDPFSHAQSLLRNEEDLSFEKEYYGKIVGARQILSNIGSGPLMLLIQIDVSLLTAAYELACREIEFRPVFKYMYYSWSGGLSMTRAMKNEKGLNERDFQATPGGGYSPTGEAAGYGADLGYGQEERGPDASGLIDKLKGIKPKGRPPPAY